MRQIHRVRKRIAVRHQSACGKDAAAVRLHDAIINVACKAEIVGVDNQAFQT